MFSCLVINVNCLFLMTIQDNKNTRLITWCLDYRVEMERLSEWIKLLLVQYLLVRVVLGLKVHLTDNNK